MELEVFRGSDIIATIQTGGKNAMFGWGLMNQHKLVVTDIKQYDALFVQLEDYILINGIKFKINTVPELTADDQLSYDITFEGPKYTWHDKLFMHEGEAEFTYYGNALMYLQLFIANINEIDPTWTYGEVTDTVEKHITFSNVTCHEAILIFAEAFTLEFDNNDKELTMIPKIGRDTALSFEYGMGKGLYQLTRNYVSDKNIVTKVYGFGGSRNLPVGYRGSKRKLTFDGGFHTNNIDLYGIKEGQYTNDDIVPEREAAVTAVTHGNPISTITDSTLDFNIKDAVIEGLEPKIAFTTGDLAGEEFVITDYNPATKVITYKGFINDNNVVLPNDTFRAQVGDKYILFDIDLPGAYVTAGESEVDAETLAYVMENSVPRVVYGGILDPIHYRDNSLSLRPGDRVNFKDVRIGLDATIRITEITMPLDFLLNGVITGEDDISVTIANFVTYTAQQRLRDEKLIVRHEVKTIDLRSVEQARRNSANLLNLRDSVIDPEGNYYTEKIKPGSIETLFLSVGAKATNFNISGVSFEPNVGGNPNSFAATAGQLIHYDLTLPGGGFIWEMAAYSLTGLIPASKYYLYAKISKSTNVGTWELATDVKLAESIAGFWVLQAGVLFPVKDGRRDNALTKGMVFIVGDQITAGRIKSLDESMFIDLTSGALKLGDVATGKGLSFNVNGDGELEINAKVTIGAGSAGYNQLTDKPDLTDFADITLVNAALEAMQSQIDGQIMSWFYAYEPTLLNAPTTDWNTDAIKDIHLGDLFYNNVTGYAYRFAKTSGVYEWIRISDTDITLALQAAQQAQDTADGKRRIFVTEPVTPYEVGDMWAQGTGGDILKCVTTKLTGSFNSAHWVLASKYTDDTVALAAQAVADAASLAASSAESAANAATVLLADIANDNLLTPSEKQNVMKEYNIIYGEKPVIVDQALNYSIDSTSYQNKYNALIVYLDPMLSDMSINSPIVGDTFRNYFTEYYNAKVSLLKLISDEAKEIADAAKAVADEARTIALESKNYIDNVLPGVIGDLQSQIDGQLESFFYQYDPTGSNAPAVSWTTPELKAAHGNDTFTNTTSGASWRWVEVSGTWQWVVIADTATQQALVLAGQALDTADGKRRVFVVTPFTPYDVGDLWTDGADLFRCTLQRLDGSYTPTDWGKATVYDSTQVTIDNGIVTAGTIKLGNTGGINAGITGNGTDGTEVRFWAGDTFENRNSAPFRVLQNGDLYAESAFIKGIIEADSGKISGFNIDENGVVNESVYKAGSLISGLGNARIVASKKYLNSSDVQIGNKDIAFGNFSIPGYGSTQNTAGFIENGEPDKTVNTALILSAYGASLSNVALRLEAGDVWVQGWQTISGVYRWPIYVGANLRTHEFKYINGWLVSVTNVS